MSDLATLTEHAVLSPAEEQALFARIAAGCQEARQELWRHNQRLIVSVAKGLLGRGMSLEELISEGQFGLARAIAGFDPAKGCKFSTYAVWWIRQSITRALACDDPIRLPVHMGERVATLRRAEADYLSHNGVLPSHAELAASLGWAEARVTAIREARRMAAPASLDEPFVGDLDDDAHGTRSLGDLVPVTETGYARVEDADAQRSTCVILEELLAELEPRHRHILALRYGLDGHGGRRTLEEVGEAFGITRKRVWQIEVNALRRLRAVVATARQITGQAA